MFQRDHKDKDSNTIFKYSMPLPFGEGFLILLPLK